MTATGPKPVTLVVTLRISRFLERGLGVERAGPRYAETPRPGSVVDTYGRGQRQVSGRTGSGSRDPKTVRWGVAVPPPSRHTVGAGEEIVRPLQYLAKKYILM